MTLEYPDRPSSEFRDFLKALNRAMEAYADNEKHSEKFARMSHDEMVQDPLWNGTEQTMADAEKDIANFMRHKLGFAVRD